MSKHDEADPGRETRRPKGAPAVHDAIVLAGGRHARLGDVDKAELHVGGRRLLDHALDATSAAQAVVVVGPPRQLSARVRQVSDVPGGGPARAIHDGLQALARGRTPSPWTLALACDLPWAERAVVRLLKKSRRDDGVRDGWCAVDGAGTPQWLLGLYRTSALAAALDAGRPVPGATPAASLGGVLAGLDLTGVAVDADVLAGVNTWSEARDWDRRLRAASGPDA